MNDNKRVIKIFFDSIINFTKENKPLLVKEKSKYIDDLQSINSELPTICMYNESNTKDYSDIYLIKSCINKEIKDIDFKLKQLNLLEYYITTINIDDIDDIIFENLLGKMMTFKNYYFPNEVKKCHSYIKLIIEQTL